MLACAGKGLSDAQSYPINGNLVRLATVWGSRWGKHEFPCVFRPSGRKGRKDAMQVKCWDLWVSWMPEASTHLVPSPLCRDVWQVRRKSKGSLFVVTLCILKLLSNKTVYSGIFLLKYKLGYASSPLLYKSNCHTSPTSLCFNYSSVTNNWQRSYLAESVLSILND